MVLIRIAYPSLPYFTSATVLEALMVISYPTIFGYAILRMLNL